MKRAHTIVKANFDIQTTKNRLAGPTHDLLCVITLPDGVLAEIQLGFISVAAMKALAHEAYKYDRVPTDNLDKATGLDPLFKTDFFQLPSIFKDGTYIAGFEAVTKEELGFGALA
jgi:hypothetical protein